MSLYRAIRIPPTKENAGGWTVERTALGERGGNVGPLFSSREEAKAEAVRLKTREKR